MDSFTRYRSGTPTLLYSFVVRCCPLIFPCKVKAVGNRQGFYLNANPDQAMEMAIRTARFMNEGQPTLSCFDFDETKADKAGLNIKVFPDYSEEWVIFQPPHLLRN